MNNAELAELADVLMGVFGLHRANGGTVTAARPTEHAEAVALMRMVRLHESHYPSLRLLFAVPNGGHRNKIVASKLKAEGVRAGVPDYLLPVPMGGYSGLAIELKTLTGYPSREQREWIESLREQGWRAEVCRGAEAAWDVIRGYVEAA